MNTLRNVSCLGLTALLRLSLLLCLTPSGFADSGASSGNGSDAAHNTLLNYLVVKDLAVPFQLVDDNFSHKGIITDIVNTLAARTNRELVQTVASVNRVETIVQYGQKQPWIMYTAKVWHGVSEYMRYLEVPLFEVRHSVLTCDGRLEEISGPTQLRGRNFAILKSFDYPELSPMARHNQLVLTDVRNYKQGFELVQHRRVNGFVEMDLRLKYNLGKLEAHRECMRFVDVSDVIPPFHIYLAVSRDTSANRFDALESALQGMHEDGTIDIIVQRYTEL